MPGILIAVLMACGCSPGVDEPGASSEPPPTESRADNPPAAEPEAEPDPGGPPGCGETPPVRVEATGRGRLRLLAGVGRPPLTPRTIRVLLPADYDDHPTRRYPVLYAHDGQGALRTGLRIGPALDALVAAGRVEPHIVVAVDTTDERTHELTPWAGTPSVADYGDFLVEVVKPLIDSRFRTRCRADDTAVLGYSYGGLASVHIALAHPDVFGRVAAMSPSLWWRGEVTLRDVRAHRGALPARVWIDAGTGEGRPGEAVPYFIRDIRALRDLLVSRGMVVGTSLGYLEEDGAVHGDGYGAARMPAALAFLLARREPDPSAASGLSVAVAAHTLRPGTRTTASVTADLGRGVRVTLPNRTVTLRASDPRIVSVSADGTVRALRPGRAELTATWTPADQALEGTATLEIRAR